MRSIAPFVFLAIVFGCLRSTGASQPASEQATSGAASSGRLPRRSLLWRSLLWRSVLFELETTRSSSTGTLTGEVQ